MLYNRYSKCAGSGSSRSLLQHLLTAAAAPYCAVLERWLRQGLLDDPYHEFMVQENQVGSGAQGHRHWHWQRGPGPAALVRRSRKDSPFTYTVRCRRANRGWRSRAVSQ